MLMKYCPSEIFGVGERYQKQKKGFHQTTYPTQRLLDSILLWISLARFVTKRTMKPHFTNALDMYKIACSVCVKVVGIFVLKLLDVIAWYFEADKYLKICSTCPIHLIFESLSQIGSKSNTLRFELKKNRHRRGAIHFKTNYMCLNDPVLWLMSNEQIQNTN